LTLSSAYQENLYAVIRGEKEWVRRVAGGAGKRSGEGCDVINTRVAESLDVCEEGGNERTKGKDIARGKDKDKVRTEG